MGTTTSTRSVVFLALHSDLPRLTGMLDDAVQASQRLPADGVPAADASARASILRSVFLRGLATQYEHIAYRSCVAVVINGVPVRVARAVTTRRGSRRPMLFNDPVLYLIYAYDGLALVSSDGVWTTLWARPISRQMEMHLDPPCVTPSVTPPEHVAVPLPEEPMPVLRPKPEAMARRHGRKPKR